MALNLQAARAQLEQKRSELQEDIARLQHANPFTGSFSSSEGVEDSEEVARETTEQEGEVSLLRNQQWLLDQVDQAIKRLEEGTYGYCSKCGQPIPEKRLVTLPWATRDVGCEEQEESHEQSLFEQTL